MARYNDRGELIQAAIARLISIFGIISGTIFGIATAFGIIYGLSMVACYDRERRRYVRPDPTKALGITAGILFPSAIVSGILYIDENIEPYWLCLLLAIGGVLTVIFAILLSLMAVIVVWELVNKRLKPLFAQSDAEIEKAQLEAAATKAANKKAADEKDTCIKAANQESGNVKKDDELIAAKTK